MGYNSGTGMASVNGMETYGGEGAPSVTDFLPEGSVYALPLAFSAGYLAYKGSSSFGLQRGLHRRAALYRDPHYGASGSYAHYFPNDISDPFGYNKGASRKHRMAGFFRRTPSMHLRGAPRSMARDLARGTRFSIATKFGAPFTLGFGIYEGFEAEKAGGSFVRGAIGGTAEGIGLTIGWEVGKNVGLGIGAAVGTAIFPGVGTAVGAIFGYVAGGIIGSMTMGSIFRGGADLPFILSDFGESMSRLEVGGQLIQTKETYTMRQRSLQAIQKSAVNARTVFSREAQVMHFNVV